MDLNQKIDELREELISSTQEIVRIRSIEGEGKENMPYGGEVALALEKALEISSRLGFRTSNLEGYVGYAEYGSGDEYVAVLGHLDVVPEGSGWNHPPYGAEIHEGKMYGRGTMDDKGPIMAALYGLKAIKDLDLPLSKKVRIIFGTNEETGSKELEYYLEKEKPPVSGFTPDAEYPIINGEKGLTTFNAVKTLESECTGDIRIKSIKGGNRPNMVPDYCEAIISAKDPGSIVKEAEAFSSRTGFDLNAEEDGGMAVVKSYGVSAHGSMPQLGKNAIMQLLAFLGELNIDQCSIGEFIGFFNKYAGFETDGSSMGIALEDKISGKLTLNAGTITMEGDKVSMGLNIRYPVTFEYEDMMGPLSDKFNKAGIRIENMSHKKPLFFPEDHPLIRSLQKVYTGQTGKEAKLLAIGGGTYAKEMPNIVAFGPIFPGKPDLDHQANEYIEIDDLVLNAKIYANAIYELAK